MKRFFRSSWGKVIDRLNYYLILVVILRQFNRVEVVEYKFSRI